MSEERATTRHYYGDYVRTWFIIASLIMVVSLPLLYPLTPVTFFVSILIIIILVICAGLTNPVVKWINYLNTLVSATGAAAFEYYAIQGYTVMNSPKSLTYFIINQLLAIVFVIALYYSIKTVRGMQLK